MSTIIWTYPLFFDSFYFVAFYSDSYLLLAIKMTVPFEKLVVYQKGVDFADLNCQLTENFSRGYGFLVDQLHHAALSVVAVLFLHSQLQRSEYAAM